jgi:predicted aminopeptidase
MAVEMNEGHGSRNLAVRARPRTRWRRIAAGLALAAVALLLAWLATPMGRYLARGAWEEARILARRRPIAAMVADTATDARTRARLQLVLDARRFAVDSIGLPARESFTTYSRLDADTLVLVLSAAYRDRLESVTWWFPVVGRVPYKGYFDFDDARAAANDYRTRGYDVYLRPAAAFSTLGWFNDPLLSTTLRQDTLNLAGTVIHELTHNRFYAPAQAVFNESFANFVGARGAAWFFRQRGQDSAASRVDQSWADEKVLAAFWAQLHTTLDSAYAAHPSDSSARVAARERVYARARRQLVDSLAPALPSVSARWFESVALDNAALLARRIYLTDLDIYDEVWEREGRDLRATIARLIDLAESRPDDPFGAVREWLGGT